MLTPALEQLLADWYATENDAAAATLAIANYSAQYQALFDRRRALTTMVAQAFFPSKAEGTSVYHLPQGWQLKQVIKYNRKLDADALESIRAPLEAHHVSLDLLVRRKPELEVRTYKQLTAEARAVVDTILTTTPGAPTVELIAPKEEKKAPADVVTVDEAAKLGSYEFSAAAAAEVRVIPVVAKKGKGKGKKS